MKTFRTIATITLGVLGFAAAGLAEDHKGCTLIEQRRFAKPSQEEQAYKFAETAGTWKYHDSKGGFHTDVEVSPLYDIYIVYVWRCPDKAAAAPAGPGVGGGAVAPAKPPAAKPGMPTKQAAPGRTVAPLPNWSPGK